MIVTPSLEAGYRFDHQTGLILPDWSSKGNDGTPTDVSLVDGKFGKAGSFNGSSSVVDLPVNSYVGLTDDSSFTISCFLKIPSGTLNNFGSFLVVNNWQFVAGGASDYDLGFRNLNTGSNGIQTSNVVRDVWFHACLVNDNGVKSIAINGVSQATGTLTGTTASIPNTISTNISTVRYKGLIDDLRIYSKAAPASDIKRLSMGLHPLYI